MSTTALAASVRDVTLRVVRGMVKDGYPLDVEEIYEAIVETYKYPGLSEDLKKRLHVFVKLVVSRYAKP